MFTFDPNGEIAKVALESINTVNTNYPDLELEAASMAFMMASVEKAVISGMDPMDYMIALALAWTFVAGMQKNIALAAAIDAQGQPPPPTPLPAPLASTDSRIMVPCAPGVH